MSGGGGAIAMVERENELNQGSVKFTAGNSIGVVIVGDEDMFAE